MSPSNQNLQQELAWIAEARRYIGLKEIAGVRHNKTIMQWLRQLKAWWQDDETPWCGTFIAHCLKSANRAIPQHWYRAKAYANYGTKLDKPCYGCIGVMSRTGGGHVCFIIGKTISGDLVCLGGNQGNSVSIVKYPRSRFTAFVFPAKADDLASFPYFFRFDLPLFSNLKTANSEA